MKLFLRVEIFEGLTIMYHYPYPVISLANTYVGSITPEILYPAYVPTSSLKRCYICEISIYISTFIFKSVCICKLCIHAQF